MVESTTPAPPLIHVENYVGGRFKSPHRYLDSVNPATGRVWARIPDSSADDVSAAVAAARGALAGWSGLSAAERSRHLVRVADLLEARLEEFVLAESRDQGKPVSLARTVDIPRAVYNFRYFASVMLHQLDSAAFQQGACRTVNYTCRQPVGVAGLITPWNLPLYLLTFKIAPALAAGCTVVAKPSELTSVTAWMLASVIRDAGLPAGVVNFVFGYGHTVGAAIAQHPDVPLVSFTGSTLTGDKIKQLCAPHCKKLSLELGGKNPALIFDDVDLEKCVPTLVKSCFANQGEICLCMSRIFVQKGIFDELLRRFIKAARATVVGDPEDAKTTIGALNSQAHYDKVLGYVHLAQGEGATIHCGETVDPLSLDAPNNQGYFMAPTIITGVQDSSRLMQEEIFGPVVCIVPFDTEEEAIRRANDVKYGLAACVWTQDVGRTHRCARQLQAGMVWCNCWMVRDLNLPFGGVKASGVGREGGYDSLDFYTEVKTVHVNMD